MIDMVQTLCNWSTMVVEEHQFNIREAAPAQICQRLSTRPCGGERATQFTAISCSDRLMMVDQNQVVYFPKPGIDSWLTWRFLPGNGRIVSLLSLRGWTDIFGSCAEVGQEVRSPDASSVQIHNITQKHARPVHPLMMDSTEAQVLVLTGIEHEVL